MSAAPLSRPVGAAERGPEAPARAARPSRHRILAAIREAAIAEFSQHGVKGTSTQAIARRAGLTKPQLHYYIAGKDELYRELLQSVMLAWKIEFAPAGLTDPARILARYVRIKLDHAFDHPEVSRIFTREILDGGHHLARYWANTRSWVRDEVEVIEGWIARGLIAPLDARILLMNIWALTQHHADFALQVRQLGGVGEPPAAIDRESVARELTAFVLRGCGLSHS